MASKATAKAPNGSTTIEKPQKVGGRTARSVTIAKRGITTGDQFAEMMSALMSDVIEGNVTPGACNSACNAGGKLLKVVEMQLKYGTQNGNGQRKMLALVSAAGQ